MVMRWIRYRSLPLAALLLMAACSGTKHLPEGEKLYTGATIEIEAAGEVNKRKIEQTIRRSVRPDPNSSFLGMRPKLSIYMAFGEEPSTRLGRWLKGRGEAPVFISEVRPQATEEIINAALFNKGYFNSYTNSEIEGEEQTAGMVYRSYVEAPFMFGPLTYAISDDSISQAIENEQMQSHIRPGNQYSLDALKGERMRIDALLKDRGYYFFNPDNLVFRADTTSAERTVALQLSLKESLPERSLRVYRINRVVVDQTYSLSVEESAKKDTLNINGFLFLSDSSEMEIRPEVILESVFLWRGEVYSRRSHSMTLNRLMSMGNFKFVQIRFAESDSAAGMLDVEILLTGMTKKSLRAEMDLVSKSTNFAGPRMNLSLQNRNAFGGAEMLNLQLAGSFEAQVGGKDQNLFSYSLNPQVELLFPRFVAPFSVVRPNSIYIPKTRLSLSYNFLKRVDYFNMNTFQFLYGYRWRESLKADHEFNPVNISYTSLNNRSDAFTALLEANSVLRASYQEMFIAGPSYSFTYNEQLGAPKKMQYYLNVAAEAAGNLFSLATMASGGELTPDNPSTILGSAYSQFAKFSVDVRGYLNLSEKEKIALRIYAGLGKAYGNSGVLPYSRQFFSGGPNSIRAFQINSVGPGTYLQEQEELGYFQLGGDMKLEMNAEYRFTLYNNLKGALFADAGNVWLHRSNPASNGTAITIGSMLSELAAGAGAGLRLDVSFFILRFDLAVPLRKPWLEEGRHWVTQEPGFMEDGWLLENSVLNVAIGYPF